MDRPTRRPFVLPIAFVLITLLAGAAARSAQDQSPQAQRPTFRAGANFVLVDAYPRRDGRVVEGLTPEDFVLFEDGERQTIEEFEFISGGAALALGERVDPSSVAEAERDAADPRNRVFVLFLDPHHTHLEGTRRAAAPGEDFLRAISGPNDLFGVLTPDVPASRLTLSRRLEGAEELLRQFWDDAFRRNATAGIVEPRTEHEAFLYQCYMSRYFEPSGGEALVRRLIERARQEQVLVRLRELVARLAAIREPRSHVLLFSGGWILAGREPNLTTHAWRQTQELGIGRGGRPTMDREEPGVPRNAAACDNELMRMSMQDHALLLQEVIDEAVRRNVAIHPVDPGGLATYDDPGLMTRTRPAAGGLTRFGSDRLAPLRALASATDGVATVGTNDIVTPLRALAQDLSSYYLLGYYSTNQRFDGRYRKIEVRLRDSDADVVARRGYLAPTEDEVRRMNEARSDAVSARLDTSALEAAFETLARLDGTTELFVHAVTVGDRVTVAAEATVVALGRYLAEGATAQMIVRTEQGVEMGEDRTPFEPGRRSGLYRVRVPPDSGGPWDVIVRVQGDLGPITRTVTIARTPADPIGARLVYRATPASRSPLWAAPSHLFRRSERLHVEWVAAGPLDSRSARLLGRDGSVLAVPVALTEHVVDGTAMLVADLRLAPLASGDYVIETTVSANGRTHQDMLAIRVMQ